MHRLLRDETVTPVATNCNNQLHICINGARASDNGPEPLFCNANARVRNSLARERREFVRCQALLRPFRPVTLEGGVSPPLSQHLDQRPGQCRTLPGLQPGLGQQQLQVLVLWSSEENKVLGIGSIPSPTIGGYTPPIPTCRRAISGTMPISAERSPCTWDK